MERSGFAERQVSLRQTFQQEGWICEPRVDTGVCKLPRDGYDFDARWDDGLASYKDKELYEAIAGEGRMLSKRLKEALNYRKGGNTGFETCITRLQMQSYVCIADFVYMQDRYGRLMAGV